MPTLKIKIARTSETILSYQNTTWSQNPEDLDLNITVKASIT
jgi:hypothetical protein